MEYLQSPTSPPCIPSYWIDEDAWEIPPCSITRMEAESINQQQECYT